MADHRVISPEENAEAPGVGASSRGNVVSLAINVADDLTKVGTKPHSTQSISLRW